MSAAEKVATARKRQAKVAEIRDWASKCGVESVSVSEVRCYEPDCVPLETVVVDLGPATTTCRQAKIQKEIMDVSYEDVRQAIKKWASQKKKKDTLDADAVKKACAAATMLKEREWRRRSAAVECRNGAAAPAGPSDRHPHTERLMQDTMNSPSSTGGSGGDVNIASGWIRRAALPEEQPQIDAIHRAAFLANHVPLLPSSKEGGEPNAWFEPGGDCYVVEGGNPTSTATAEKGIQKDVGKNTKLLRGFVYVCSEPVEPLAPSREIGASLARLPYVDDLFVHPEWQGKGLGSRLLAKAEAVLVEQGHTQACLAVLAVHTAAHRFYHKHHWRMCQRFVGEDSYDYLVFKKALGVGTRSANENAQDPVCTAERAMAAARPSSFWSRMQGGGCVCGCSK
jgi:GNAT superfamily N-acetyltransferase